MGDLQPAQPAEGRPRLHRHHVLPQESDSTGYAVQQPAVPAAREREGYGQRRRRCRPHHEVDRRKDPEPEEVPRLMLFWTAL